MAKKKIFVHTRRNKKLKRNKNIKMVASGPVNQIGSAGVRYHQNYVYDQLRYTVLTLTLMSKVDKDFVESVLKTILTGPDAMLLPQVTYKDGDSNNNKTENLIPNGWACTKIGYNKEIFLVSYKGVEVAIFYKRQLTEIKLQPGDRFPESVLQDPQEAWQRLDLLGQSAKKANFVLASTIKHIEDENKLLTSRVKTLEELNDKLESDISKKEEVVDRLRKEIVVLKQPVPKKRRR